MFSRLFSFLRPSPHPAPTVETKSNFMVVLRESIGANVPTETLIPLGKFRVKLEDGREMESEMAAFELVGDVHVRFVFDAAHYMPTLTPEQFAGLRLEPAEAIRVAVGNIKRVYGEPRVEPWAGLLHIHCDGPDYNSSFFLDRDFWRAQNARHPEGLVVCIAKRGGIVFAPLSDANAVDGLKRGVAWLYNSSGNMRLSAALYLFKDGVWTVFQAAGQAPSV